MRIISGEFKGRTINFLKNSNTRPLKDSVRESIFNILNHSNLIKVKVEDSNILDLYCGIGSFGLECISRGSKKISFVERDNIAIKILKENLVKLSIKNKTNIFNQSIEDFLKKNIKEKYDIFFLDPPFKDLDNLKILENIREKKIFNTNHIVLIHREIKSLDDYEKYLDIVETKHYGRSKIIFGKFKKEIF